VRSTDFLRHGLLPHSLKVFMPVTRHYLAGLLSTLACPLAAVAAEAPAAVFGQYAGAKCPKNNTTCVPANPSDQVHVARGTDGKAKVSVRIAFGQGHTCRMDGNAEWTGDKFTLRADGLDPNAPCELALKIQGSMLTLEDPDSRCQPVYCGARGVFNGTRFVRRR